MMKNEIAEMLSTLDECKIFSDPDFDDAIIGITTDDRVVYSFHGMIESLMNSAGITYEEAKEFIEYNTIRSLPYEENAPVIVIEFGGKYGIL